MENNTDGFYKEFDTSVEEMNRRKVAFRTLALSLFVSICITTVILLPTSLPYYSVGMGILGFLFLLLELSFNRLFEKSKKVKFTISNREIERIGLGKHERCSITSINSIRIKRTTANQIREIRIARAGNGPFYLNGVERFDTFKDYLLLAIGKNVKIYELREPIDFDHPLFYAFFGTLTGVSSIIASNLVLQMNPKHLKTLQFSVSGFIFAVGIYWFFSKPISGRYGQNKVIIDYVTSISLILIVVTLILLKMNW